MNSFENGTVILTNGLFKERENVNLNYLLELDSMNLLQNFYLEAGIILPNMQVINNPGDAKLHWGWESPLCQLRGHFLGHWLSAASKMIANYKNPELLVKLNHIIDELERCQELNGGKWVGSIPEKFFKRLERTDYIWSPQYTMHKTCMGLMDTYKYTGNKKALKILNNLADWYVKWVNYESKHCPQAIYNGEQGGMLEIWASMYEITGYKKYIDLANAYSGNREFEQLSKKVDALYNVHANANILLVLKNIASVFNMVSIALDENKSVTHDYLGKFGSATVLLKKAPEGTGIIAGGPARIACELAGVKNIRTKSLGSNNKQNVVMATIKGLSELKNPEEVAKNRGKSVEEIYG